jgi:hypothetical protein
MPRFVIAWGLRNESWPFEYETVVALSHDAVSQFQLGSFPVWGQYSCVPSSCGAQWTLLIVRHWALLGILPHSLILLHYSHLCTSGGRYSETLFIRIWGLQTLKWPCRSVGGRWVRDRVRPYGISFGRSGAGEFSLRLLRFPLPILILPIASHWWSAIIWGWYTRSD